MNDIFNFLNQENKEEPQNMGLDSLEALQYLSPKAPLATIRTYKTAREISNEIAMSTPFERRSEFYRPEYVDKNIDFVKLSKLISNQKDIVFNWEDYIGTTIKTVKKTISHGLDAKFDRAAGNPTSYTETVIVKRENPLKENTVSGERVLNLNARLNTEIGLVNIHKDSSFDGVGNIEFDFNYEQRKVAYKLHYYYDGYKRVKENNNKGEIAFTVSSPKYDDFDAFLNHSKIRIAPKVLEKFQNEIIDTFKKAIMEVSNYYPNDQRFINQKYSNLQWIYENIPYFVGQHLDFDNTLKIVLELSSWDKGSAIIDTTKSILKALRILNPLTVYDHFNKNPQKIIDLFDGFQDDNSVEQFCTFLTAIVLVIKGKSFSEDKARVFELSEDKHIETNFLYGDDKGKVELVNERDRPVQYVAPKFSTVGFFVYPSDEEINNPTNASNQFHPFDIVYLSYYDEMLQTYVKVPTIAIYAKYLGDKGEWENVLTATFAVIDVISIILSGGALVAGVRGIARIFAIIDITVSTINLAILSPTVKQLLSRTEAGKWFVTHWPIISFCVSAGMLSHYLAKGILKYGKTVKGQLKNNPKLGKQIEELIEESKKVEGVGSGNLPSRIVTRDPKKVKEFIEGKKRLDALIAKGIITRHNAIDYLEDVIPYFNHKVLDGEIIIVGDFNCINVVRKVEEFLKSGKLSTALPSKHQSHKILEKFYNKTFTQSKIPELKAKMKNGERAILWCKREPKEYPSGLVVHDHHVVNIIKINDDLMYIDGQVARFLTIEDFTYTNSRYIELQNIILN